MAEDSFKWVKSPAFRLFVAGAIAIFLYLYGSLLGEIITESFFNQEGSLQAFTPILINVAGLIVGTEIFLIITKFIISKYLENKGKKKEIKVILTLYTYLVWTLMGIFLASTIFKDIGALLTSVGLIGFGITFALQKPILNFVGWLVIVVTKPFNIGDRIEVLNVRGDVLAIHTMYTSVQGTRIDRQEKSEKIVTIPNELLFTNPVSNYSRRNDLFEDEATFSITMESNWRKAIEIAENVTMATISKYLKPNPPATIQEKKAWQEALKLLTEASRKMRRGTLKESVKENIGIMKTAETTMTEIPKPNIQINLAASSYDINVLYRTDLRAVRTTKHEIVRGFLEAIEKRGDIELAYPHVQFVEPSKHEAYTPKQKKLFNLAEAPDKPA